MIAIPSSIEGKLVPNSINSSLEERCISKAMLFAVMSCVSENMGDNHESHSSLPTNYARAYLSH